MINSILRFLAHICLDMYIWLDPGTQPGLQDLDIWTDNQMRAWIKEYADMGEFITGDIDEDECEW